MAWSLRARGPSGQATLGGLDASTSVADLQAMLEQQLGVPAVRQELLGGFPPRLLELPGDRGASIASAGISNGDTLVVREAAAAAEPTPEPTPAAAPPAEPTAAAAVPHPRDLTFAEAAAAASRFAVPDMDEDTQLAAAIAASMEDAPPPPPAAARSPPPRAAAAAPSSYSHPTGATTTSGSANGNGANAGAPTSVRVPGGGGGSCIVRRIIASDNSCLFNAVGYVMEGSRARAPALRAAVAAAVAADPARYSEAFLGQTNPEYCAWILNPKHWGGAIELSILSAHYKAELAAYDVQTQRVDVYGQGEGYAERAMLIYDGLHYDALALSPSPNAPEAADVTRARAGSADAERAAAGAAALVAACHAARQFTDTANFTLRCGSCLIGLRGEKEAVEHAKTSGHTNFQEY